MNLRRRTMAASIAFIALALLGTSSYSVAKDDSVSAGICLADKRFAMLDQELSLTGNLADRAERITAEVMGSPEITSIEERQALTSDDSARSMVQRTLEVPASPGIPGARAVAFDEVGNPYVVMSPNSPVADIDRLPYSGAVDVTVLTSCITDKEIVDLRGAIQKESDRPALLGYNAFDDVLILITDESLDKVQKALAVTTSRIELIDEAVGQFARGADAAPHFAGSIISNNQAGGFCSSGFRVWNAAFGNLALSAGHCGNLNQTKNSGTNFYGTIVADSTSLDLLMMNGSTYAAYLLGERRHDESEDQRSKFALPERLVLQQRGILKRDLQQSAVGTGRLHCRTGPVLDERDGSPPRMFMGRRVRAAWRLRRPGQSRAERRPSTGRWGGGWRHSERRTDV